jgi:hypothetical protein
VSDDRLDLARALVLGAAATVGLAAVVLGAASGWRARLPPEALEAAAAHPVSTGPAGRGDLVPAGAHPAVPLDHVPGLHRVPPVLP